MKTLINFFKSMEGHGVMILLLVSAVMMLSIYLLQQLIIMKYPEWIVLSWFASSFLVVVFEVFVFFCAVNGYKTLSGVMAIMSFLVLFASTYELISTQPAPVIIAVIVFTLFPPFGVWFLSHKVADMHKKPVTGSKQPLFVEDFNLRSNPFKVKDFGNQKKNA